MESAVYDVYRAAQEQRQFTVDIVATFERVAHVLDEQSIDASIQKLFSSNDDDDFDDADEKPAPVLPVTTLAGKIASFDDTKSIKDLYYLNLKLYNDIAKRLKEEAPFVDPTQRKQLEDAERNLYNVVSKSHNDLVKLLGYLEPFIRVSPVIISEKVKDLEDKLAEFEKRLSEIPGQMKVIEKNNSFERVYESFARGLDAVNAALKIVKTESSKKGLKYNLDFQPRLSSLFSDFIKAWKKNLERQIEEFFEQLNSYQSAYQNTAMQNEKTESDLKDKSLKLISSVETFNKAAEGLGSISEDVLSNASAILNTRWPKSLPLTTEATATLLAKTSADFSPPPPPPPAVAPTEAAKTVPTPAAASAKPTPVAAASAKPAPVAAALTKAKPAATSTKPAKPAATSTKAATSAKLAPVAAASTKAEPVPVEATLVPPPAVEPTKAAKPAASANPKSGPVAPAASTETKPVEAPAASANPNPVPTTAAVVSITPPTTDRSRRKTARPLSTVVEGESDEDEESDEDYTSDEEKTDAEVPVPIPNMTTADGGSNWFTGVTSLPGKLYTAVAGTPESNELALLKAEAQRFEKQYPTEIEPMKFLSYKDRAKIANHLMTVFEFIQEWIKKFKTDFPSHNKKDLPDLPEDEIITLIEDAVNIPIKEISDYEQAKAKYQQDVTTIANYNNFAHIEWPAVNKKYEELQNSYTKLSELFHKAEVASGTSGGFLGVGSTYKFKDTLPEFPPEKLQPILEKRSSVFEKNFKDLLQSYNGKIDRFKAEVTNDPTKYNAKLEELQDDFDNLDRSFQNAKLMHYPPEDFDITFNLERPKQLLTSEQLEQAKATYQKKLDDAEKLRVRREKEAADAAAQREEEAKAAAEEEAAKREAERAAAIGPTAPPISARELLEKYRAGALAEFIQAQKDFENKKKDYERNMPKAARAQPVYKNKYGLDILKLHKALTEKFDETNRIAESLKDVDGFNKHKDYPRWLKGNKTFRLGGKRQRSASRRRCI